jgi:hypothetical protein
MSGIIPPIRRAASRYSLRLAGKRTLGREVKARRNEQSHAPSATTRRIAGAGVLARPLIWIKPVRLERVGNAGLMKRIDFWFVLSLVWLCALFGGMVFVVLD